MILALLGHHSYDYDLLLSLVYRDRSSPPAASQSHPEDQNTFDPREQMGSSNFVFTKDDFGMLRNTNLLTQVPKAAQQAVATRIPSIFAQPDAESVRAQHRSVVEHLESRFPKTADRLAEAEEELLAFTAFPKAIWRQIWPSNPPKASTKKSDDEPTLSASSPTAMRCCT